MEKGTKVRMSEIYKRESLEVSWLKEHIEEFGDCEGVVLGSRKNLPQIDVIWFPSNCKFGYLPKNLERV
jgi:hypothetical protein